MAIIYKNRKEINPKEILNLYKSVGWADNNSRINVGKSIALAYKNSQVVFSAWEGNELIGVVRGLTDKSVNGVIFGLVVRNDYQRKGIGKKLLEKCIRKYPKVRWYLWAGNSKAERFYKKIGMNSKKQILFERLPKNPRGQ